MKKTGITILLFSAAWVSAGTWAAGQMKPGLWEMTIKSDAMKNMPKIPPEQIEKMRQMGIDMPHLQDGGMVTRVCITKEMAERGEPSEFQQKDAECKSRNMQHSGNAYSADIVCDGPNMKGTGKVQGTFSGNESFTSSYDFRGTAQGRPVSHHQDANGRFLNANCGNVAPVGAHPARK
ncbi:MAG TPA: DUF3617 domain-containing protein [Paucimonas sp.]|nr:DUF3617 domain-containing protein [Paucimonas sp.]